MQLLVIRKGISTMPKANKQLLKHVMGGASKRMFTAVKKQKMVVDMVLICTSTNVDHKLGTWLLGLDMAYFEMPNNLFRYVMHWVTSAHCLHILLV